MSPTSRRTWARPSSSSTTPNSARFEALRRARLGAYGLDFTIARLGAGFQRIDQHARDPGHLDAGAVERHFIGLRGLVVAGELADELQRSRVDLVVGRRRGEIEQGFDVSAHGCYCKPNQNEEDAPNDPSFALPWDRARIAGAGAG